jgi:uncharacterized protein YacL
MTAQQLSVLSQVRMAVVANMRPGFVLWSMLVALLLGYATVPAVATGLAHWGAFKQAGGFIAAFLSYVVFAVLVPEVLSQLVLRQRWTRRAVVDMAFAGLVFGCIGITVDLFYALQVSLFGDGNDLQTIVKKCCLTSLCTRQ